jgi:hypothetical protein
MLNLYTALKNKVNNLNFSKHTTTGRTHIWGLFLLLFPLTALACKKDPKDPIKTEPSPIQLVSVKWNQFNVFGIRKNAEVNPTVRLRFSNALDTQMARNTIKLKFNGIVSVDARYSFENNDSTLVLTPLEPLKYYSKYVLSIPNTLKSSNGGIIASASTILIRTTWDPKPKFSRIPLNELMNSVQQKSFNYFWEYAHPVSKLARERLGSDETVTSGGSGFGIMAGISAVSRNFITKTEFLDHMLAMTDFLWNKAQVFHGAYPHWLNGTTGRVIPFSPNDDGADLVETSYLIMGLLSAKSYFNSSNPKEVQLRAEIDSIWHRVDWNWFTKNGKENTLYWHWSPNKGYIMNMPIRGWNECLITHVLAAASPTHPVKTDVYHQGWAKNGAMKNGKSFYGIKLPLGEDFGGPLFFSHYSFLGINPKDLSDDYADYWEQNQNHSKINYEYCKSNPKNQAGYRDSMWGLTASDNPWGYNAHSPTNDLGVISPTAALSAFPFTPEESTKALEFFYYTMGDLLWKKYGFVDAFCVGEVWAASSFLAIDQGPIVVMMENYRTQLLWNLFTADSDVKSGMKQLNFKAPYLN